MYRNILVCLGDERPQWILRTIWALCFNSADCFLPFEMHVLATRPNALHLRHKLLHPEQGKFVSFVSEYGLEKMVLFDESRIHQFYKDGLPVDSIQDEQDSYAVGLSVMETIRGFCSDPGSRVHASLNTYNNNTPAYYLGCALSIFGRQKDRLSCTVAEGALGEHPDFYYPSRLPRQYIIHDPHDNAPVPLICSEAKIRIVPVPFPFFGQVISAGQMKRFVNSLYSLKPSDGSLPVSAENAGEEKKPLDEAFFDPVRQSISCNGADASLTVLESAVYHYLVDQKQKCLLGDVCHECKKLCFITPCDLNKDFIVAVLRRKWGDINPRLHKLEDKFVKSTELRAWFLQHRSRINKKIRQAGLPASLSIISGGVYGSSVYGIPHDKEKLILAI